MRDGRVKFKVSDSQNFWRGKGVCYQSYSEIYGLQEQMGVADFSRMARPKSEQVLHHWARRSIHSLDVQELTKSNENKNAKSLNYWLCKFVQEVGNKSGERYPSRTLYNIVCGLERFLVKKNGEGALNPLAVSDKRYHWKSKNRLKIGVKNPLV